MAEYSPYYHVPTTPPQDDDGQGRIPPNYGSQPPPNGMNGMGEMPGEYPPQAFIPVGAPVLPYCSAQNYTFVQGVGFMLRSPEDVQRQGIRRNSKLLAFSLLLYLLLFYTVRPIVAYGILRILMLAPAVKATTEQVNLLALMITYLIAMLVPFLIYRRKAGIPARAAFPMKLPRAGLLVPGIFITLALSVAGDAASSGISVLLRYTGLFVRQNTVALPKDFMGIIFYALNFVLLAPILEEVIFRGIIMQSLRRYGDGFALVASSVVFALMHLNLLAMPFAFLAGLAIGYFVLRTGSLITGIVLHFTNNLCSVLFDLFTKDMVTRQSTLYLNILLAVYLLLGLISLIFVLKHNKNMFKIMPSQTVLGDNSKLNLFFSTGAMFTLYVIVALSVINSLARVSGTTW